MTKNDILENILIMLERYKKDFDGIIKLAKLLETAPLTRRKQIVKVGIQEDYKYMEDVLSHLIEWTDILNMNQMELSELLYYAKPEIIASAICNLEPEQQRKFLVCCEREKMGRVKDLLEYKGNATNNIIATTRLSLIATYRELVTDHKLPAPRKDPEEMKKKLID